MSRASSWVRRTLLGFGLGLLPALCLSQQISQQNSSPPPVTVTAAPVVPAAGDAGNASRAMPADLPLRRDADSGSIGAAGYLIWLLLVVGAIAVLGTLQLRHGARPAWLMKSRFSQRQRLIKVVGTAPLGSGNSLQVVHWNGEELLLGCTAQSISLLGSRAASVAVDGVGNARSATVPEHPGAINAVVAAARLCLVLILSCWLLWPAESQAQNVDSLAGSQAAAQSEQRAAPLAEPTIAPSGANRSKRPIAASPAPAQTAQAVRVVVGLTLLAIVPALLVCLTSFLRTIIVLSMLRHAIGMPETPPNTVLIGLALFMTLFTMSPVLQTLNDQAVRPFMDGKIGLEAVYQKSSGPLRDFMVRQTREQDLALMIDLSKAKRPESLADISNVQLVPAFMLSELRAGFQIGFVIFLPFLLIDLIVSSVLMALGMMMMPPTTVALPLKILMFILVDGWSLVLKALVGSFH